MGNQQGTQELLQFKLGWLIGMIEGEGLVGLYKGSAGKHRKNSDYYRPVIKIYNTDEQLIARCHQYLTELNVPHYIYQSTPRIKATGKEYKPLFSVYIQGIKRCEQAIEILKPEYFSGQKKENMFLIRKFVQERLKVPMTGRNQNRKPSATEIKIAELIRQNNLRGKGSRLLNDYTLSQANNA